LRPLALPNLPRYDEQRPEITYFPAFTDVDANRPFDDTSHRNFLRPEQALNWPVEAVFPDEEVVWWHDRGC